VVCRGLAYSGKDLNLGNEYVEKILREIGVAKDGLAELPDSEVMPGFELSCIGELQQRAVEDQLCWSDI